MSRPFIPSNRVFRKIFGVLLIGCVSGADSVAAVNSAIMDSMRWSASEMFTGGEDIDRERKIRSELYRRPSLIDIKQ